MPSGIEAIFLPIVFSCHSTLSALYSSPPLIRIAPITVCYQAVQEMLSGCWQGRRYTREPLGCRGLTAEIPPSLLAGGIDIGIPAHSHRFAPDCIYLFPFETCRSLRNLRILKMDQKFLGIDVATDELLDFVVLGFFCCCGFLVFVFHFH